MLEFTYEFDEAKMSFFVGNNSETTRKWTVICRFKSKENKDDLYSGKLEFINPAALVDPKLYAASNFNPDMLIKFDELITKIGHCDFTKKGIQNIDDKDLEAKLFSINTLLAIISPLPAIAFQLEIVFFEKLMQQLANSIKAEQDYRIKNPSVWTRFATLFTPKPTNPPTTVAPVIYKRENP